MKPNMKITNVGLRFAQPNLLAKEGKLADGTVVKYDAEDFPVLNDVLHVSDDIKANTVKLKLTGTRADDFKAANELAGINNAYLRKHDLTWHHHQDLGIMQLVPSKYHSPMSHTGGVSLYNQYVELGMIKGPLYKVPD